MKKHLLIPVTLLLLTISGIAQTNVGINDNGSNPDPSAVLDVYSASKGLLIPRVGLLSSTDVTTISSPVASLLVYNTNTLSDLIPGYYYWDGTSKWIRLISDADPYQKLTIVNKSETTTLLKSENLVSAVGDITLSLPAVTSEDNGLEITVKNNGSYTDLVTVIPQTGKTIDANTMSKLTRWRSRTFVAFESNWIIKEKETRADNLLDVSPSASFVSISEVIAFLEEHMCMPTVIRLGGGTFEIDATQTIDLPYPLTIEGISYGETTIQATEGVSGTPMFICETECYFKHLIFNAFSNSPGNDAIRFTGADIYYEVKDSYFYGFNKGLSSTNNNELWVFENDFEDCEEAGIEIAAGTAEYGFVKISETDFYNCTNGVHLLSGVNETVSIINATFYNTTAGSDIGISYDPSGFTSFESIFITNNAWNNEGSFIEGFDFTRSDGRDANAFIINNAGTENKNPHCRISVNNNSTTTTVYSQGTFYKANWTNSSIYTCKWNIDNNKMTYQTDYLLDALAIITGNLTVDDNNLRVTIAIIKNGNTSVRYGETDLRITSSNQPFQFSTVIYIPDMAKDDYLELYVTSSQNGDVIKFQDVQWFVNTQ